MDIITLLFLAAGLSMDAFAVAICKGLSLPKATTPKCLLVGVWFGSFQGLMPLIGYLLGVRFASHIESFSSWIAFALLTFIGGNLVRESYGKDDPDSDTDAGLGIRQMFLLAVATSIDALAVGITFACVPVKLIGTLSPLYNTVIGCLIIALVTCILSFLGVKIGNIFGIRYKQRAEFAGGFILIMLGLKILIEYLFI